jgi:hypothetical protein
MTTDANTASGQDAASSHDRDTRWLDTDVQSDGQSHHGSSDAERDGPDGADRDGSNLDVDGGASQLDRGWGAPKRCDSLVTYPPDDRIFDPPNRDPIERPPMTRSWIEATGRMPHEGGYWGSAIPSNDLHPRSDGRNYDLYAHPGDDVSFEFAMAQKADSLDDRKLFLSILVDYEPVEFEFERWDPEREHVVDSGVSQGLVWEVDDEVSLVDVTIPASVFDETRMYEIETAVVFNERPVGVGTSQFRRYALHYGGYSLPSHPCFEPALQDEMNQMERELVRDYRGEIMSLRQIVGLIPARADSSAEAVSLVHPATMEVAPGEEVTFNVTFTSEDKAPAQTVGVPILDGVPLDIRWFHMTGEPLIAVRYPLVSTRKQFTMTAPTDPGRYYLYVASWRGSYQSIYDENDERDYSIPHWEPWIGSNFVILEVASP